MTPVKAAVECRERLRCLRIYDNSVITNNVFLITENFSQFTNHVHSKQTDPLSDNLAKLCLTYISTVATGLSDFRHEYCS